MILIVTYCEIYSTNASFNRLQRESYKVVNVTFKSQTSWAQIPALPLPNWHTTQNMTYSLCASPFSSAQWDDNVNNTSGLFFLCV